MNNEIMNNEMDVDVIDMAEDAAVISEDTETSGGKNIVGIVLALAAVGVGIAAIARRNKGKLDEWRIKRLEKKGYVVIRPEAVENDVEKDDSCEESAE